MRHPRLAAAVLAGCTLLTVLPATVSAQGWLDRVKKKAKETIQQRADQATDSVTNAAFDKAEHVVKCVTSDKTCIKNAQAAGQAVAVVNAQGQAVSTVDSANAIAAANGATGSLATGGATAAPAAAGATAAAAPSQPPGVGAWLNYDFIPGDRVLFFDDFSGDHVGDLPTHEDITQGNATVVDINGTKYFRSATRVTMWITLPEVLPQRFTIEADFHGPHANPLDIYLGDGGKQLNLWCYQDAAGVSGSGPNGDKRSTQNAQGITDKDIVHCRFMVDGGYAKVYLNNQRLGQLNGLVFTHTNKIKVEVPSVNEEYGGALLTNFRVAEGGKPLYDALAASGRVTTHGILFATGSATIQGESTPTLAEIGQMLKAHPDLKLEIDGHTDNVGSAASNMTLSDQRAAAVKQYLANNFQIDASRLTSKGFGATKPIAANTTDDGRAQNRRVELVKI